MDLITSLYDKKFEEYEELKDQFAAAMEGKDKEIKEMRIAHL
jgi:hypothetical protein